MEIKSQIQKDVEENQTQRDGESQIRKNIDGGYETETKSQK